MKKYEIEKENFDKIYQNTQDEIDQYTSLFVQKIKEYCIKNNLILNGWLTSPESWPAVTINKCEITIQKNNQNNNHFILTSKSNFTEPEYIFEEIYNDLIIQIEDKILDKSKFSLNQPNPIIKESSEDCWMNLIRKTDKNEHHELHELKIIQKHMLIEKIIVKKL